MSQESDIGCTKLHRLFVWFINRGKVHVDLEDDEMYLQSIFSKIARRCSFNSSEVIEDDDDHSSESSPSNDAYPWTAVERASDGFETQHAEPFKKPEAVPEVLPPCHIASKLHPILRNQPPRARWTAKESADSEHHFVSVYVGPKKQRFVIRSEYLNHHLFKMLLKVSEEEFGAAKYNRGLCIMCEPPLFERFIRIVQHEFSSRDQYSHPC